MNREHYDLLKQGVDIWNTWRKQHPDIRPDLSGANLSGEYLSHVDFSNADLSGTSLSRANLNHADLFSARLNESHLSYANLSHTYLNHADLGHADLSNADLSYANLSHAYLSYADLSYANLNHANFGGTYLGDADLSGADFSGARLWLTVFTENDLSTAKGLATINHEGRSHISLHTVKLPQDGSTLHFLRGAGVPDEWIDFWRSTMIHPIQYHSLFISYSSQDGTLAHRLHADLQAQGVRCWFAPHDLRPGTIIRKEIDQAIHLQEKLLLLLSKDAVTSGWVDYEVEVALAREREQQREILFPVRLDESALQSTDGWAATLRRTRHIGNFTNWMDPQAYQTAFDRLLQDLKKADNGDPSSSPRQ